MTTPDPPPFDPGNALLKETPALMTTATVPTPTGQRLVLTIRTASTTVTVLLTKDEARAWGRQVLEAASKISAAGLVVAGPGAVSGNGKAAGHG